MAALPDLSRLELQCLRRIWQLERATVRQIHADLAGGAEGAPSYSTVRKIVERLEDKGAVARSERQGKAWVYRATVSRTKMLRKEVRRFLDAAFGGSASPLIAQLADMDVVTLEDLREIERQLGGRCGPTAEVEPGDRGASPGGDADDR
jgi:BlaI family penicillinase repressor